MSASSRQASARETKSDERIPSATLAELLLVRIACSGGATRAQLVRDLAPVYSNRFSPAEWREALDVALQELNAEGNVRDNRGRLRASETGAKAVAHVLGEKEAHARAWSEQRDVWLVAKALGVDAGKPSMRKAVGRPESLAALLVQDAFGLSMRQALSPPKLRSALALVALERAFGNGVKSGLKKGAALSAQAGRVLAGQLFKSPRELTSDGKLIAALAAEVAGTPRADVEMLRLALLRRLAAPSKLDDAKLPAARVIAPAVTTGVPASRHVSAPSMQRPGLAQFSAGVINAARTRAEGWPGSRKAFISEVWKAIRTSHPEWGLSEIEFKDMLAGAHRAGQLVLATADLKNKQNVSDLEASAILYKNTVWHFVRVED